MTACTFNSNSMECKEARTLADILYVPPAFVSIYVALIHLVDLVRDLKKKKKSCNLYYFFKKY